MVLNDKKHLKKNQSFVSKCKFYFFALNMTAFKKINNKSFA